MAKGSSTPPHPQTSSRGRSRGTRGAAEARAGSADRSPPRLDDESERLMAAVLEFSALLRRPEPTRREPSAGLALGRAMQEHGLEQRHASALLTVALYGPMTVTQLANRH